MKIAVITAIALSAKAVLEEGTVGCVLKTIGWVHFPFIFLCSLFHPFTFIQRLNNDKRQRGEGGKYLICVCAETIESLFHVMFAPRHSKSRLN